MKKITFRKVLLLFILLFSFFIYYQSQVMHAPLHTDERAWISRGAVFFDLAVLQRDFSNQQWQGYSSYDQSKLPEYIYGFLLYVAYHQSPYETMVDPNSGQTMIRSPGDEWEKQTHIPLDQVPSQFSRNIEITELSRRLNVYFGVACLLLIFIIGQRLLNYYFGLTSLIILAINPLFQSEMYTAKADIIFLCILLATYYLSLKYLDKSTMKNLLFLSIFAGLTAAAKLHGLFIICILVFGLVGRFIFNKQLKKMFSHILLLPIIAYSVFILINPFTWINPVGRTFHMLNSRYNESTQFCINYPVSCAPTLKKRLKNLSHDLIGIKNENNSFYLVRGLDFTLLIVGIITLINMWEHNRLIYSWLIFWSIGMIMFISFAMFFRVPRYYMILLPWICFFESFGLVGIVQITQSIWRKIAHNVEYARAKTL